MLSKSDAGWSSLVARRAHNPKVVGSNPAPATNLSCNKIGQVCAVLTRCELSESSLNIQGPATKNPDFRGFLLSDFLKVGYCLVFKLGSEPFFCFWSGLNDWFRKTTY